jgi:hypothetical protein
VGGRRAAGYRSASAPMVSAAVSQSRPHDAEGWLARRCEWVALGAWARRRTTPPAGGRTLVAVDGKTLNWPASCPHRRHQHHRRCRTPSPTTSASAADPQDPLINDLAGVLPLGPKPKSVYRNRHVISIPIYRFRARPSPRTRRATN